MYKIKVGEVFHLITVQSPVYGIVNLFNIFIRYYYEKYNRELSFLTNAKPLSALDVANLYKKRWLIELFFKWFKQHLKIKKFWGTRENVVRIQISVAIVTYCLVAIVQYDMITSAHSS